MADTLSRLPEQAVVRDCCELMESQISEVHCVTFEKFTLMHRIMQDRTAADPVLKEVIRHIRQGWPNLDQLATEMHTYHTKREELQVEHGLVLWRDRITIPTCLRSTILYKLHETHPGIVAMKNIAKDSIWWPKCGDDIEQYVRNCGTCQTLRDAEAANPLHLWNIPDKPWKRIRIDFTGPYDGKQWFVVIDAHSRWLEIFPLWTAKAQAAISALRTLCARYGLSSTIVSDNGSQFRSHLFKAFAESNNIKLIFTTPYHSRRYG